MKDFVKTSLLVMSPLLLVAAGISIPTVFNVPITFTSGIKTSTVSDTAGTGAPTFAQGLIVAAGKVLKADSITTTSGGTPPGMVPLGGMVAVMPNLDATNAWQPPASGAIKDGFMVADGSVVPAGQGSPLAGKSLPNMAQRFPRGNSTTSGATGGSPTVTSAVTVSSASFTGTAATYSVAVPAHYHGVGTGAALAAGGQSFSGTAAVVGNTESYAWLGGSATSAAQTGTMNAGSAYKLAPMNGNMYVSLSHTHAPTSVTGTIGLVTGGVDGNVAQTASGTNTPAGSVSVSLNNGAVTYTPQYVDVVWVVRVK